MLSAVLKEYGIGWAWNRGLYSVKLKLLRRFPIIEKIFEKTVDVKRLDIFDIDINQLRIFLKRLPGKEKKDIVQEADDAIKGKILGFSSVALNYGNPINWQMNPLTGKQTDSKKKWYQIPDFDADVGDIKVIWEASRFSHLVTFARAFLITGDVKYYQAFSKHIADWLEKNPYSYGANYKCGQECSIRAVNALFAYTIFHNAGVVQARDEENLKKLVQYSYQKVLSNFFYAYRCIKNNHTISEIMGMIVGAWCCEDEEQLSRAYSFLEKVIADQFTEDGGYAQFSFNYQRLALQDLDAILSISEKTKRTLSEQAKMRIRNSALLLYQCQAGNGDVPNYGSNDGALIFRLTSCGYRDFRPVVNTTCALLDGYCIYGKDNYPWAEELIWYGIAGVMDRVNDKIVRESITCSRAGLYTLRKPNAFVMLILNEYGKRPGHMDQMHIDFWVKDVNVLCDGGTYSYASELGQKLIREESHNTVSVLDTPQMCIRPPFLIFNWTSSKVWVSEPDQIGGMMKSKNGYKHSRVVRSIDRGFEIDDKVEGNEGVPYTINFHTPCQLKTEGHKVSLIFAGTLLGTILVDGDYEVLNYSRSLYYLQKEESHVIKIKGKIGEREHRITKILIEEQ